MPTAIKSSRFAISAVLFLLTGGLLYTYWSEWPWSTIGVALAFAGVLFMLLRDAIKEYGNDYTSCDDADLAGKPFARLVHPYAYAVGVPLVVLGALLQMLGNPSDNRILRVENIPDKIVFLPLNAEKKAIDASKLEDALRIIQTSLKATDAELSGLTYPELQIVNCGSASECPCPADWVRVKDLGGWNLNAGTASGDTITLCTRSVSYVGGAR